MTTTIHTILDQIRNVKTSEADKGTRFEELIRQFLLNDPVYRAQYSNVWRWMDYPGRAGKPDTGIDLVAERSDGTGFVAIQCKFYDSNTTIQQENISSFLALSSKQPFTHRILVSTTAQWSTHAEDMIHGQTPSVQRLGMDALENSSIDWSQYDVNNPKKVVCLTDKKKILLHQEDALEKVREGFKEHDRGQLIMACGTGKTFTSLKIAEEHAGKNGLVLFLVPSLSLLSQTLREWLTESAIPLHCYAVCSDTKIGKHDDGDPTTPDDIAIPATTDGETLAKSFATTKREGKMTVVFSTYQSIEAINEAQKHGVPQFDLIICDEAHRTTGAELEGKEKSHFVSVHDNTFVKAKKRLYMTATPRLYSDESKKKAKERSIDVWSMDDEKQYGIVFYYLGFSQAVSRGLLADYKVVILGVEEHVATYLEATVPTTGKNTKELPLVDPAKIIGCWNALAGKYDDGHKPILHRAVAFTTSIKQSKTFQSQFDHIVEEYRNKSGDTDKKALKCEVRHVDGNMNALERNDHLQWLKEQPSKNECRILSNAKCLSEGVDVPALDAVMFLTPRKSKVDIVQSVGRVMRKSKDKGYGYIILPIVIKAGTKPEDALNDNEAYEMVWGVLQALRAHDDRFQNQINVFELDGREPEKIVVSFIGKATATSVSKKGPETHSATIQPTFGFSYDEIKLWKNALYATLVKKCGEKRYWEDWAKDVAKLAEQHIGKLEKLADDEAHRNDFSAFLDHLRNNLNDSITERDAVEMLAQHIITKPVFDALFNSDDFSKTNPVAQALDKIVALLEDATEYSENNKQMEEFYESVRNRVQGVETAEGRQKIIIELYDKFFKTAFPKLSKKLGIVYTPVEMVDFIIKSVDQALRQEFSMGIGEKGIHILDPFTGTGTFIVRLLQSGLIDPKDLYRKYHEELHANEIVLLAYYIAAINIGSTYHEIAEEQHRAAISYTPFPGIVHTDTFTMTLDKKLVNDANSKRAKKQKETPITVIIGNPPYSTGQRNQNDANKNTKYEEIDKQIQKTYVATSTAALQRNLYDPYIRAFRWASDRIGDKGVVCYVTNAGYIDANAMDGFRKCLAEEFTDIYVFNLRGGIRGRAGDDVKKEGQNVFPIMTAVAITLLIKNPAKAGLPSTIHYRNIDDNLDRKKKLQTLAVTGGLKGIQWATIMPNKKHDWVNQRDESFDQMIPLGDKSKNETETIFETHSLGVVTGRDAWCHNFSKKRLAENMKQMIAFYNEQVNGYTEKNKNFPETTADDFVDNNPTKISWTRGLKNSLSLGNKHTFQDDSLFESSYRPFCKTHIYFNRIFNESPGRNNQIFPKTEIKNFVIAVSGVGSIMDFTALIVNQVCDLAFLKAGNGGTQVFPYYTYEQVGDRSQGLIEERSERFGDYIRRENISDTMLRKFQERYNDQKITKEDIFYYVYGILHSRSYRERFASELKKQLPRIPMADDFRTFSQAGRQLADLHLNYETSTMYPLKEIVTGSLNFKVEKMKFPKTGKNMDKSRIIYNSTLTLEGIPPETYKYVVNGKSALEWIIDRYARTTHPDSKIVNDPNDWCKEVGNEWYIIDLIKRIVHLSAESVKIIDGLPKVGF